MALTTRKNSSSKWGSKNKRSLPPLQVPENFQVPEPKPLSVTRLTQLPTVLSGGLALAVRGATGVTTLGWKPNFEQAKDGEYALKVGPVSLKDGSEAVKGYRRPKKPIYLYEYEASPYCRKVREACSLLDLTVSIKPCPRTGTSFREELDEIAGQLQFPYMLDENTGEGMFESDAIIEYLFENYGPGKSSIPGALKGFLSNATCGLATAARAFNGAFKSPFALEENAFRQELTLWGYEGSPFVKPVREELSALQLPHKMIFCARGSANRERMIAEAGRFQVPYLQDPNTGIEMFESYEIVQYLKAVYSSKP